MSRPDTGLRHDWRNVKDLGLPDHFPPGCAKCGILKNAKNADGENCPGKVGVSLRRAKPAEGEGAR